MDFQKWFQQPEEAGEIFSSGLPDNSIWQQADPKLGQHPPKSLRNSGFFPGRYWEWNWLGLHFFPSAILLPRAGLLLPLASFYFLLHLMVPLSSWLPGDAIPIRRTLDPFWTWVPGFLTPSRIPVRPPLCIPWGFHVLRAAHTNEILFFFNF